MSRRAAGAAALLACAGLIAGCGSRPAGVTGTGPPPPTAPLSTSLVTAQGTWAVTVVGGPDAGNEFWQLFFRPVTSGRWSLVTPQGVADNGGLVAAGGVRAAGFGPGGSAWLLLGGGRAKIVSGAAESTWRALPPVPAGTEALVPPVTGRFAPGPGGTYDALAVAGSRLTVWRLTQGAWAKVQQIAVPVQYGSSG